ncbi:hypothetical protein Ciccas_005493 [Cichlidogyrus casuarinus]|uniref:Macoilin n=1 Tax=Cichlidogyrus casuarinus TaxID=1844966 RepID=A0ABD2Q8Y0_9PLAT
MLVKTLLGFNCDLAWPLIICVKSLFDRFTNLGFKSTFISFVSIVVLSILSGYMFQTAYIGLLSCICSRLHLMLFYLGNGFSATPVLFFLLFLFVEVFLFSHQDLLGQQTVSGPTLMLSSLSIGFLYFILCEFLLGRYQSFIRSRLQRSVQHQNASYYCLLETALPEELWCYIHRTFKSSSKALPGGAVQPVKNAVNGMSNGHTASSNGPPNVSASNHNDSGHTPCNSNPSANPSSDGGHQGGSGDGGDKKQPRQGNKTSKDETTVKLEAESRKLRSELQALRSIEADLRRQMTAKMASERASKAELEQVKVEFETLTGKLESISKRVEIDRQNLEQTEKKLVSERKFRQDLEQELTELRKTAIPVLGASCNLLAEQNGSDENGLYDAFCSRSKSNTCTSRIKKLENEIKSLTKELSAKESQISNLLPPEGPKSVLAAAASLAVGAAITPDMSEQLQIKKNEFQRQELSNLKQEVLRLRVQMIDEEENKSKITQAYLDSLKKVTDLQATLADKECEISSLNEQLEKITHIYFTLAHRSPSSESMPQYNGPVGLYSCGRTNGQSMHYGQQQQNETEVRYRSQYGSYGSSGTCNWFMDGYRQAEGPAQTLGEMEMRPPSPRDFMVPASVSTGRSRIVDNYYAKRGQNLGTNSGGGGSSGLLFTVDSPNSSNEGSPPPLMVDEDENRTMQLLEGMLEEARRGSSAGNHDMLSKNMRDQSLMDDLNTLD